MKVLAVCLGMVGLIASAVEALSAFDIVSVPGSATKVVSLVVVLVVIAVLVMILRQRSTETLRLDRLKESLTRGDECRLTRSGWP